MRKISFVLLVFTLLALPAQTSLAQDDDTEIGIGVGFTSGIFGSGGLDLVESIFSPANIYVPITFNRFRLEPQFGIVRSSDESGTTDISQTLLALGTGVFGLMEEDGTVIYYGGRIGIVRFSTSTDTGDDEFESSSTNVFLGPAVGAEHFLGDDFSLGGEAQLMYTSLEDDEDEDSSASLLRTRAIFFVRLHF